MKNMWKLNTPVISAAVLGLSLFGGAQGASATTVSHEVAAVPTASSSCGFDFWAGSYHNCGSSRMRISVQYVMFDGDLGNLYLSKPYCVAPHSTKSVVLGSGWIAEAVIDNGPANGPGKC